MITALITISRRASTNEGVEHFHKAKISKSMDLINKCGCTSKKAVWALAGAWNPRCVAICNTMIQGYSPHFFSSPFSYDQRTADTEDQ